VLVTYARVLYGLTAVVQEIFHQVTHDVNHLRYFFVKRYKYINGVVGTHIIAMVDFTLHEYNVVLKTMQKYCMYCFCSLKGLFHEKPWTHEYRYSSIYVPGKVTIEIKPQHNFVETETTPQTYLLCASIVFHQASKRKPT